jgi:hypothetical protein
MNSKIALTAIVVVAAIMAFGAISPAMAAPNDHASDKAKDKAGDKGKDKAKKEKVPICHVEEDDPDTPDIDESSIDLITVPTNSAHHNPEKHPLDYEPFVLEDGTLTCEEPVIPEPEPEEA